MPENQPPENEQDRAESEGGRPPYGPPQGAAPQEAPQYAPPQYAPPQGGPQGPAGQVPPSPHAQPQQPPYAQQQPYPQQPYAQPGAMPPPYGYVLPSGRRFWAMGFLTYIPYVGFIVFLIVSLALNSSARRDPNEVVRENARWAANWALSVATFIVGAILIMVIGGITAAAVESSGGNAAVGIVFVVIGALVLFATGITHLVFTIMGTVQADRRVFTPAIAIPYLRARS